MLERSGKQAPAEASCRCAEVAAAESRGRSAPAISVELGRGIVRKPGQRLGSAQVVHVVEVPPALTVATVPGAHPVQLEPSGLSARPAAASHTTGVQSRGPEGAAAVADCQPLGQVYANARHCEMVEAPTVEVMRPFGQFTQALALVAPACVRYVFSGQGLHAVAAPLVAENVPGSHGRQVVAPASDTKPGGQKMHMSTPTAAIVPEAVPAGQTMQPGLVSPGATAKVPEGQAVHVLAFAACCASL